MGFKLLVVDDEPIVRRGIRQLVRFEDLSITDIADASDGVEALEISKDFHPDIVMADINMPNMDGLTFARELKKVFPNVHLIIITGYDQFEYTREALRIGVDDYILKPVSRVEIEKLLRETTKKLMKDNQDAVVKDALLTIAGYDNEDFSSESDYQKKISALIAERYADPFFSFKELAASLCLSEGHLSRLFGQQFHQTFPEYLSDLRLEHARLLIIGTTQKVYEVAEKCGYEDPNYFSTAFKKKYNYSPNQYREYVNGNRL